jgi:phosphatidylserine/phosphatidylglycerophosphate/cardiolipin synthase-like enzyme
MAEVLLKIGSHRKLLSQLAARTDDILRVVSPYVTDKDLLRLARGKQVRLLTALFPLDIVTGATSLEALRTLIENGVKCRVLALPPKLHAKVYIFDRTCGVVTSANLTASALDKNLDDVRQWGGDHCGR